jgi:hypothetical protein
MLNEIRQGEETNTVCFHLIMESKPSNSKKQNIELQLPEGEEGVGGMDR